MKESPILGHKPQLQIWKSPARFKVTAAGRRFGKTFYIKERLAASSEKRNSLHWYVAPTRSMAKDLMWEMLKDTYRYYGWAYEKNESELSLWRPWKKSVTCLKSAELKDRLRGRALDGVTIDEFADIEFKTWTECIRPALSDKRGWAEFFGTPKGFNHFYKMHQEAKTREGWASFQFKTIDSPFFQTPEGLQELEDARRDLDERTFNQEYNSSFETFAGRLCYAFDRQIHNSDHKYDPNLPIYVGQDFNRNPMCGVLFQLVAGRMIAFREMYINTSSTEEVCRILKDDYPNWNTSGIIFRPDATGKRRTSNASKSDHQIIKDHGFIVDTRNANPSRVDRWAACNKAFANDQLLINVDQCPRLTNELETLLYKEGTCEPNLKGDPSLGHLWDGFGYNVYKQFPVIQRTQVRVSSY